jgi:hypothetical protein
LFIFYTSSFYFPQPQLPLPETAPQLAKPQLLSAVQEFPHLAPQLFKAEEDSGFSAVTVVVPAITNPAITKTPAIIATIAHIFILHLRVI